MLADYKYRGVLKSVSKTNSNRSKQCGKLIIFLSFLAITYNLHFTHFRIIYSRVF